MTQTGTLPKDIPGAITPTGYVLPAIVPATYVPETYSSNDVKVYVGPAEGGIFLPVPVMGPDTETAKGATTVSVTSEKEIQLHAGSVLIFGSVPVKVKAPTKLLAKTETEVPVEATSAVIPADVQAYYTDFPEFPLAEDSTFVPKDTTETVNLYGSKFAFSSKNMMDADVTLKTLAGIKDPVTADLVEAGKRLGGQARRGIVFVYPDGNVIFGGLTIGAGFTPTTQTGNAMRYNFSGKLAGQLYTLNLNDADPKWEKL